jgi:hypothetical protein
MLFILNYCLEIFESSPTVSFEFLVISEEIFCEIECFVIMEFNTRKRIRASLVGWLLFSNFQLIAMKHNTVRIRRIHTFVSI